VNPLHERIRRLPAGVEFLVVLSFAFGLPIFTSIVSLGTGAGAATGGALVFTNAALLNILVFELLQSAFLIWFLRIRGWTLEKVGLSVTWRGTGAGWLLFLGTYLFAMGAQYLARLALPVAMQAAVRVYPSPSPDLSMELVFLVSTVNGFFEELFVAGYIITALRQTRGMWSAINVSIVVRVLYHLYQGPIGVLNILPMGLLYAYVYARTRQLWPLMLAHVLVDLFGLSQLGRLLER
jgi:membrane protease YdiL (CAAX protease family)